MSYCKIPPPSRGAFGLKRKMRFRRVLLPIYQIDGMFIKLKKTRIHRLENSFDVYDILKMYRIPGYCTN